MSSLILFLVFAVALLMAVLWDPGRRKTLGWVVREGCLLPFHCVMGMTIASVVPTAGVEPVRNLEWLASKANGSRSFAPITLVAIDDSASTYVSGTVLGQQIVGSAAVFAISEGVANTTCGTITLSATAEEGVYTATYLTGASATAEFSLQAPNGLILPSGKIGTAYSGGGLGFTLTDGGTHPGVGDQFTITVGAAAFTTNGGDTGDPTCSAIVVDPGVVDGVYNIVMTDATHFTVTDPNSRTLSSGVFGTQYNDGGLTFTLTAGGDACIAGDGFKVTATTAPDNWTAVNASASDGSQYAAGILVDAAYVGGSANVKGAAVVRDAEINYALLTWPSGSTPDQELAWKLQLKALDIISLPGLG